jgi:hypothetical protein
MAPSHWRAMLVSQPPERDATVAAELPRPADPVEAAIDVAGAVASDGRQRALECTAADPGKPKHLRSAVRKRLYATPDGSPLRHVLTRLGESGIGGAPVTTARTEEGFEVRLSRYA